MKTLPRARLLEALNYNRETGEFTWRIRSGSRSGVGDTAGHRDGRTGYIYIKLDGVRTSAHRLAWFYVTGAWPSGLIDHIDVNGSNNAFNNLREASHSLNKANRHPPKNNTSGYKGVSYSKQQNKWQASICRDYKQRHLGFYDCIDDAVAAYRNASIELFGSYARAA